jgi:hypothetical protein
MGKGGCFVSRGILQTAMGQGIWLMIASGLSACPVGAKDLTFQPFVGNMGAI